MAATLLETSSTLVHNHGDSEQHVQCMTVLRQILVTLDVMCYEKLAHVQCAMQCVLQKDIQSLSHVGISNLYKHSRQCAVMAQEPCTEFNYTNPEVEAYQDATGNTNT